MQTSTHNNVENIHSRYFAVGTLENLSCLLDYRSKLVECDGLLLSLMAFTSDANIEHFAKESVKSFIVKLVSVI